MKHVELWKKLAAGIVIMVGGCVYVMWMYGTDAGSAFFLGSIATQLATSIAKPATVEAKEGGAE